MFHNVQHALSVFFFFYERIRREKADISGIMSIRNSQSCRANDSERILQGKMNALLRVSATCSRKGRPPRVPLLRNATDKKFLGESAVQRRPRIPGGEIYRISRRRSGRRCANGASERRTLSSFLLDARFSASFSFLLPFLFLRHLRRLLAAFP